MRGNAGVKGGFEVIGGDEIERALIQERTRTRLMRPVAPSVDGPRAKAEVAGRGLRCPLGEPPLIALPITGLISARLGGGNVAPAVTQVLIGGAAGLVFTYGIGHLFGAAIG